jgi:hypothetical protein
MSRSWPPDPVKGSVAAIVPTNTHIILFRKFPKRWADPCLLVQAFTIPDNQCPVEKEKGHLRLTHEGILYDKRVFAVIRNSVVDPITGAINVKLLARHQGSLGADGLHLDFEPICIDLTLEKSPDDVLPITINQHYVLVKGDVPTNFFREFYDVSDDGYARGFFAWDHAHRDTPRRGRLNVSVVKFTIDATQDRCVVDLCRRFRVSDVENDTIVSPLLQWMEEVLFDGVRGRLSYVENRYSDNQAVVIVDIE